MMIARASMSIAALALCASLVACSGGAGQASGETPSAATPSTAAPTPTRAGATPPAQGSDSPEGDEPVVKVERAGHSGPPSVTAEPADTDDDVTYDDGVRVRIDDVTFGTETAQGPGSFPDREYTRVTISLENRSDEPIDLSMSVLTLLDADGAPAERVYAAEAEVSDFGGTVAAGKTATAAYAFALPEEDTGEVTLVVDFDGEHTSAVFRGGLD